MGGLLYKDFVSINRIGKVKMTWLLAIATILFIVLRILFPGTKDIEGFIFRSEDGEIANLIDAVFLVAYGYVMLIPPLMLRVSAIMGNDEKNKIKGYLSAMPIGKNTYVASKYIFIGFCAYVMLSIDYICGITNAAFCGKGLFLDLANMLNSLILICICVTLFVVAIEIPLHISLGKEKAMRAMVVFWTVIAFFVLGYLMFGDLSIVSNWNILALKDFMKKHATGVLIFQNIEPMIVLVIYYFSYRLSCYLYHKKGEN